MNLEEIARELAGAGPGSAADGRRAEEAFAQAWRRAEEDSRERERIRDINDLVDAQDAVYEQALAAVDRGDLAAAEPLLRSSAEAGVGEAAWLLATVLEQRGQAEEALPWYERAAVEGDSRAVDKLAELNARLVAAQPSEPDRRIEEPGQKTDSWLMHQEAAATWLMQVKYDCRPEPELPAADVLDGRWRMAALADLTGSLRWADMKWLCRIDAPSAWQCRDGLSHAWLLAELRNPHPQWAAAQLPDCNVGRLPGTLDVALWVSEALRVSAPPGAGKAALLARLLAQVCRQGGGSLRLRAAEREPAAADLMLPLASASAAAPGATLHEAMEQVLKSGLQALPVTEGPDVVGVVTLADLANAMHQAKGLPSIQRVETLMRPPVTVEADAPVSAVMATAARSQAGLVIVTGPDGEPAGYLTPESLLATPGTGRDRERQPRSSLLVPGYLEPEYLVAGLR